MSDITRLKDMIASSGRIVFFGGAGVSTESGIPDFRSENGIYDAIRRFGERPETLLSHSFFMNNTKRFYEYYRSALLVTDVQPNHAHKALAELERQGKLTAVVTQNIDGLHTKAGSKQVIEVHGEFPTKEQLEAPDFASTYRGIVLYDDVAPRYDDAVKLVKSLEYGNSHFVIVGTSFYTGISQKLLKLAKQRKATVIVIDENAVDRIPVICNNLRHIYGMIRKE